MTIPAGIPAGLPVGPAPTTAERVFRLIRSEMLAVEEEFERQARSNIQIISHLSHYLQQTGGKRVRPALLILAAKVFGEQVDQSVIEMAAVMEFLHTATLVHDDIIDGAEFRRGRQTVSSQWGNDTAVLMGDWLYMTAFQMALQQRNLEVLDALTEATRKMTEGELLQLTLIGNLEITEDQHLDVVVRKTGYLFSASCRVGAILRGASPEQCRAMADYGLYLGIAFQLIDDLLDFTADAAKLGKPVLSDLREGKVTLPLIRLLRNHSDYAECARPEAARLVRAAMKEAPGETRLAREVLSLLVRSGELDRARNEASLYVARAQESLLAFPDNQYRRALSEIAQFMVERDK